MPQKNLKKSEEKKENLIILPENHLKDENYGKDIAVIFNSLRPAMQEQIMRKYVEECKGKEALKAVPTINLGTIDFGMWKYFEDVHIEMSERYPLNERGFSELFADVCVNCCRYNLTSGCWYYYDKKRWVPDVGNAFCESKLKLMYDTLLSYGSSIERSDLKEYFFKKVNTLSYTNKRKNILADAKAKYCISADMLDCKDDLLNLQNGTLNLKTLELSFHNPNDLLTKICNVDYEKDAWSRDWDNFMDEITCKDTDKMMYLCQLAGYALTAETNEEGCYVLYGSTTRNGKSTFIETLSYMLGGSDGYARTIQPQTLAAKNQDSRQANGDIARLKGCRFLSCSEFPKRMVLDAALLKQITGRDTITARELYQAEIEFTPCYKLFLNTNYLPQTGDTTLFDSNRVHIISFDRHFEEEEQDKTLKDRLRTKENLSGILNWCLLGLNYYRSSGLIEPKSVKQATNDYLEICDKTGNFFNECMVQSTKNSSAGKVYEHYKKWCIRNGYNCENKGNFFDELKRKSVFKSNGKVNGMAIRNVVYKYEIKQSQIEE